MRASRLATLTIVFLGAGAGLGGPGCASASVTVDASAPVHDASIDTFRVQLDHIVTIDYFVAPDVPAPPPHEAGHDAPSDVTVPSDGPAKADGPEKSDAEATDAKGDGHADAAKKCVPDAGATPGIVQHTCIIYPAGHDDDTECDGNHDPPAPFPANGTTGNGFDDNCNGLVDEGCACDTVGAVKPCYLVPPTQTVGGLPVGWCAANAVGTVACEQLGGTGPTWSGVCRGALPPYPDDLCVPGDFNCDGVAENSTKDNCTCTSGVVECPTEPVKTAPFPPATSLPLEVNAASWFVNASDVTNATGWQWTLTGGDCDNILPHPTFSLFGSPDGTGVPVGTQSDSLGALSKEQGIVATGGMVGSSVYPAFSIAGDYLLTGSWMLNGQAYSCSVKVQAVAPGVRVDGCWTTEDQGDALTLHLAKIDDFPQCSMSHCWSNSAPACSMANEDCYYADCYLGALGSMNDTDWGYSASPASACNGWGSQTAALSCKNPRLDRDTNNPNASMQCDPTVANPNVQGNAFFGTGGFCGPENINLDNPANNDRFAVGVDFFGQLSAPGTAVGAHVDVFCDGQRVFSGGYDPVTGASFPNLITPGSDMDPDGSDSTGDMWKVGIITTSVTGAGLSCSVAPAQSVSPDPKRDGSTAYCVDDTTADGVTSEELLTSTGLEPANADALCYH
jgi:hypothetical protein